MTFADKYGPWAVVAGASEGTGREFARQLGARGLNCLLVARRRPPLEALATEIREAHGVECLTACIDLAAVDAADTLIGAAGDREVGLLVSNAGADTINRCFLDNDVEGWTALISRNITTVVRCCHHFGGRMRERGRGGILLVGSGSCYGGASRMAVYAGTKAFDLAFGEGLWAELRPHGVDVLNLILGRTDTPALRRTLAAQGLPIPPDLAPPAAVAEVGLSRLPHGPVHNWGQADEEAGMAPASAAARRARVLAIDAATRDIFRKS